MLRHLTIGKRFVAASSLLCVFAAMLAAVGYGQIRALRGRLEAVPALVDTRVALAQWQGETASNAARTVAILRSSDTALGGKMEADMKAVSGRISGLQKRIEVLPLSERTKARFAQVGAARHAYIGVRDEMLKLKREHEAEAEAFFDAKFAPALGAYQKAVQAFVDSYAADYAAEHQAAERSADHGLSWLAAGTLSFFLVTGVLGWLIVRSITYPVRDAVAVAEAVARGDLTVRVESHSKDELGRLMEALRGTVGQLGTIVRRIKEGSDTVATASREIAQGNADLSTRTEQQASALEETSASMQQMTATVGQNAENAKRANELAAQASNVAAKGGEAVRDAVGTMNEITEASKKIADIIGVIDGIAFQTNILALNAAVEAARAGEQGRGFAVVASEVRSLAQRSAAAAKEIKGLITDSVSKVDAGSRQVNDAGRTMEEVVGSVRKVTSLIAEITAASQEQAQGIEQVSETMTQLEKVTQQNAAMVEEASAAAGSLEDQSRALSSAVAAFRLGEEAVHSSPAPKSAPTPVIAPKIHFETAAPQAAAPKPAPEKHVAAAPKKAEPHVHIHAAKTGKRKSNGHAEEGWQEF